jgi:hypothetical protein
VVVTSQSFWFVETAPVLNHQLLNSDESLALNFRSRVRHLKKKLFFAFQASNDSEKL